MNYLLKAQIAKYLPRQINFLRRLSSLDGHYYSTTAESKKEVSNAAISKELLVKMRKETGYSYVRCRKALIKFGEQNYAEAVNWMKEMAGKEGWEKAAKLSVRTATQGLCALIAENNVAVMVEIGCETDFVARNTEFKSMIQEITSSLLCYARKQMSRLNKDAEEGKLSFVQISPKEFYLPDGRSVEEAIVSYVGRLGENITLKKANVIFTNPSFAVIGHTHPTEEFGDIQMGRFLSFVALKRKDDNSGFPIEKLGRQICHHIIGMSPETLGEPPEPEQVKLVENEPSKETKQEENEGEDDEEDVSQVTRINENETQLLRQPFMFNPQQTIFEYLNYHGATVSDFMRMEMGQEDGK